MGEMGSEGEYQIFQIGEQFNYGLGNYSSKEKAMKVLNDIQCRVKYRDPDYPLVYEMPQDDEVEV